MKTLFAFGAVRVAAAVMVVLTVIFATTNVRASDPRDCCGVPEGGESCYLDVAAPCSVGEAGDQHCAKVDPNFPKCCPALGVCHS